MASLRRRRGGEHWLQFFDFFPVCFCHCVFSTVFSQQCLLHCVFFPLFPQMPFWIYGERLKATVTLVRRGRWAGKIGCNSLTFLHCVFSNVFLDVDFSPLCFLKCIFGCWLFSTVFLPLCFAQMSFWIYGERLKATVTLVRRRAPSKKPQKGARPWRKDLRLQTWKLSEILVSRLCRKKKLTMVDWN